MHESMVNLGGDIDKYMNKTTSGLDDLLIHHQNSTLASLSVEELSALEKYLDSMFGPLNFKLDELIKSSVNKICDKNEEVNDEVVTVVSPPVHTVSCGGSGWRRAVYLNVTDPNSTCPSGWRETGYSKRTCGRATDGRLTCDTVTIPVSGKEYSQVCGRIKAYQWGLTSGFYRYNTGRKTINEPYASGVVVMHGSPRQHIWTFAAGGFENQSIVYFS